MVKIKTKKEMNLPELIEWGCKNEIEGERYLCNKNKNKGVSFNSVGNIEFDFIYTYSANDTFTVEVEEEITEDTVIPKILVKTNYDHTAREYCNSKINQFLSQYYKAFYIVNDDLTMTLIWKNGKLVE